MKLGLLLTFSLAFAVSAIADERPNVLFISIDDLNDWTGCLGGHPQAKTPNLDRLAAKGCLFTNAHCPAPACNPSRGAILSGISPHRSGLYDNRQSLRDRLPDSDLMPRYFSKHGYWSAGSGKILHYVIDAKSWDDYFPSKETEDPFPRTFYPLERPVSLPVGGTWQYVETDWAALDLSDEEFGGDWLVTEWIGEQLSTKHSKPFFLACGIYRPHEPWFVPAEYFEPFPLEEIQLPPGYLENDLDDLPPAGAKKGPNRYFAHIQEQGQWKRGIQGYLASIYFADSMLGRVLDALENGPNKDNTIVVLWSDHGWHLGEKQHWQKFTGWRACTRVPLTVYAPPGCPGLPEGTRPNTQCAAPVSLLSLFPTLTELTGLPHKQDNDGPSLVPLLRNRNHDWDNVAMTFLGRPGNYAVSGEQFRLISYDNGDRELYDVKSDPFEWKNLAQYPKFAGQISQLESQAPKDLAPYIATGYGDLPKLEWLTVRPVTNPTQNSSPTTFNVVLSNKTGQPIVVRRLNAIGESQSFGTLETGWTKPFPSTPNALWEFRTKANQPLGYFLARDFEAFGAIPPSHASEN